VSGNWHVIFSFTEGDAEIVIYTAASFEDIVSQFKRYTQKR